MSEEIVLGCYADLKYDMVFKKAFASEADKELLIALLNAFLERKLAHPITDVEIKNPYVQGETKANRDSVVDIRCKNSAGDMFIVEMQMSQKKNFVKRAMYYLCMSIADSGRKGDDYDFNFPNAYSLNFLDFDVDFSSYCSDVVEYFSVSNEDHPQMRFEFANIVFVRLPRFVKPLAECESLRDKLIYSLCHAHECKEQPEQLRGNIFDRLFTVIKICNFSVMELEEYRARAMWKADRKAELDCARDEGIEIGRKENRKEGHKEVFALLDNGISLTEAKKQLGYNS
jgi:predicted transposase/invertase (TIGR01784 family)